jgi:hypothetical protein
MAKRPHQEQKTSSSRATIAIMAIGGILVAALVVWALTRTVEPAPEPAAATTEASGGMTATQATTPATTPSPLPPGAFDTTGTTATTPPPAQTATSPSDGVQRITVDRLRELQNTGGVTLIDVRDEISFMQSHIPGSLHIPMARVEVEAPNIPKDKPIVTYCT